MDTWRLVSEMTFFESTVSTSSAEKLLTALFTTEYSSESTGCGNAIEKFDSIWSTATGVMLA